MPMHAYVLAELERTKGKWPEVAAGSGVSKRTIEKIARGEIADPSVSHVQKLADYFRREKAAA
ncbi:unnamed protein product [Phaeothamnion confervicola]